MYDSLRLVRSHVQKRCSILRPTRSRISPRIVQYTEIVGTSRGERVGVEGGYHTVDFEDSVASDI